MSRQLNFSRPRRDQAGAATLVVVMVLFFVMSLVAAYASRNIIFEQRTSSNQYQATTSLEAAEAGLNWALGLLNAGRIDDDCRTTTDDTKPSFRERYLAPDAGGNLMVSAAVRDGPLWPICWFDSVTGNWVCRCPSDAASPGAPASLPDTSYTPSFRVRFVQQNDGGAPTMPGLVRVEVMGCNRYDAACLSFPAAHTNLCRGTLCAHLTLYPGVKSPPQNALTARGDITVSGALSIYAGDAVAIASGGAVTAPSLDLRGPAAAPAGALPVNRLVRSMDPAINATTFSADRLYAAIFGMWPATHRLQPASVIINCAGTCDSDAIRSVVNLNPGRVFIADGDVTFDGGGSIGSAAAPIALVVNGQVSFSSPTDIYGLLYVNSANWTTSAGTGRILGAAVAQQHVSGSGNFSIVFDKAVLERLRLHTGSFIVPPGGWRDFP